ncbi:MAG: hypothetical protein KBC64_05000 [Simkaniaceae bacterium]|nr:hypothetical protein [Simkaniaceae bacterium]
MRYLSLRGLRLENLYYSLIFLYFLTSSMERIHFVFWIFKIKATNFVALFLMGLLLIDRKMVFLDKKHALVFVGLLISFTASALCGSYLPRTSVYVIVFILHFFAYYLLTVSLFYYFKRELLLKTYVLSFFAIGIYGIFQLVISIFGFPDRWTGQFYGHIARVNAFCYEPSYYVLYLCPIVFFANYLYFYTKKFSLMDTLLLYLMMFISLSTSAFFFYLISTAFFFFLKSEGRARIRSFLMRSGCTMLAMGILFRGIFTSYFLKFFAVGFTSHHSFIGRWRPILLAVEAWLDNPWLGVGAGGMGPYFIVKNNILPLNSPKMTYDLMTQFDPTNTATDLLASLGVMGMVVYGVVFYLAYVEYKACFSLFISDDEKFIIKGLFFSWIMMLVIGQFNPGLFRPYAWIHTGVVFGYIFSVKREKRNDTVFV